VFERSGTNNIYLIDWSVKTSTKGKYFQQLTTNAMNSHLSLAGGNIKTPRPAATPREGNFRHCWCLSEATPTIFIIPLVKTRGYSFNRPFLFFIEWAKATF
jgi:hypothetical protein